MGEARSGETVTTAAKPAEEALLGYEDPKPMVFCGLYPVEGDDFAALRDALEKLRLNDSSFTYQPESSGVLGFGFRCGFLGLLHMEIVRERLEREFDLALIATAPSVEYLAHLTNGKVVEVDNPSEMPPPNQVDFIEEPHLRGHPPAADRVHGHGHGAVPDPPGRAGRRWSTCRPSGSSWSTASRWPRWSSTSSTSSRAAPRATPASTTS